MVQTIPTREEIIKSITVSAAMTAMKMKAYEQYHQYSEFL